MNTAETLEKMSGMRLSGMKQAYALHLETPGEMTADELTALLVESEFTERENRRTKRLMKNAKFRYKASAAEIEFSSSRGLDKGEINRLMSCDFIFKGKDILITGPTGAGKSFIASALGHEACARGYKVIYYNIAKLLARLKMLKADRSDIKELDKLARTDLLILDDFGLQTFDSTSRLLLLEIIEDRHGRKSTIISSQLPVQKWYEAIGDDTIADAILDRLVHGSFRIEMKGESMRKIKNIGLQENF